MSRQKTDHPSDTQVRLLRHIPSAIADRGEAPSLAELAAATGMARSSVHYQLRQLQEKGALAVEPHQARGIRLT
ncbi:LexA family protein [Streptomyces genisteinicus]|uniref:Helix-turn-helix domain-containing protein n=1 Tax=Streptomyces genisteinicus TaxID=2768068 RepID=A0A7H0I5C7_9ACTN|nr:helix-turn-helix domain-containing protein [Streptomyces genisteinicus]QNP67993.1 helix-turn-helix domain-containing protein [Streptomyces genisteinicus]